MIKSKEDLQFYLKADRIANGWPERIGWKSAVVEWLFPDYIRRFQESMRAVEYYSNQRQTVFIKIRKFIQLRKFRKLSVKLGFSIPENVFGPGLSIAHYGTIVVNPATQAGANCRLHTGVNIGSEAGYSNSAPTLGDNCYIGPGAKLFGKIEVASDVAIGANAVVNKSISESRVSVAGAPAKVVGAIEIRDIIIPAAELARSGVNTGPLFGLSAREVRQWMADNDVSI